MTANLTGALVNSIYPLPYFSLAGVTEIEYPDKFWWSSKERFAAVDSTGYNYLSQSQGGLPTSEILEIDLGRVREINYLNFDVLQAPINITIEYDALSTPDREPVWRPVTAVADQPFDDSISFVPQSRTAWQNVEFVFGDNRGLLVHTRYLRITFARRDETWPTSTNPPFPWPVFVKSLRVARNISSLSDTAGPILNQDTPNGLTEFAIPALDETTTTEVRQQFVIPVDEVRAGETPNLIGFGVLVHNNQDTSGGVPQGVDNTDVTLGWSIFDVTNSAAPVKLAAGTVGPYTVDGEEWIDLYFDPAKVIRGDTTKIYELRVNSQNSFSCNTVYTHTPNGLSSTGLPGLLTFTNGSATIATSQSVSAVLQAGQYIVRTDIIDQPLLVQSVTGTGITLASPYVGTTATVPASIVYPFSSWNGSSYAQDASRNLVMRIWADVADSGQDILGNAYRYVVRRQQAKNVLAKFKSPTRGLVQMLGQLDYTNSASSIGTATATLIASMQSPNNSIIVGIKTGSAKPVATVTDNRGNVYSKLAEATLGSPVASLWACLEPKTPLQKGDQITFTLASGALDTNLGFVVGEYAGINGGVDKISWAGDQSGTATSATLSLGESASQSNEVAIALFSVPNGGSWTAHSPYLSGIDSGNVTSNGPYARLVDDVLTSTEVPAATVSWTNASKWVGVIATFKSGQEAGWMSDPMPTPEAVEALYFDVRNVDPQTGQYIFNLIQAIEIAPRTPGVQMNVYYSQENIHGSRPSTTEEWDNLVWTPINETYVLRRDEIVQLPTPVTAAYMKLEFTALNPMPYRLPSYPPLPPKQYRRYPTWIESQFQNAKLQSVVSDWFLRNATPVERSVLQTLADPVKEYQYEQSLFLAQLALGTITDQKTINSGLVDVADKAIIDPVTGSKIYIQTSDQYSNTLLVTVDQSSVLGQMVVANYNTQTISQPTENQDNSPPVSAIPVVSTVNDRISQSYQSLARTPMRFNKTCRHIYTVEQAEFNKKAYFVGIDTVRFLRVDYSQSFDDPVVTEPLYDDTLLIENTWERESETNIPDGGTVYISYQVGDTTVTSEAATLAGFTPYEFQVGGAPARNVVVFSEGGEQGLQFFQGLDYQLGYGQDSHGNLTTFIERSPLTARLSVPIQALVYQDAFTVVGHAHIPSTVMDAATVRSIAKITAIDAIRHTDSGKVVSIGKVTGNDTDPPKDTWTVIGVGKPTGTDTHEQPQYGSGSYGTGTYGKLGESPINP